MNSEKRLAPVNKTQVSSSGAHFSAIPRTQVSANSIKEIAAALAAHSAVNTRRWLGPRDKPEENIRGDETAVSDDRVKAPTPPPVFPETPQALSGIFPARCKIRSHND
jgi:hypothetical protein